MIIKKPMQDVVTHNNPCNPNILELQAKSTEFFLKNPAPDNMKNPAPKNNRRYVKSGTYICKIWHLTKSLTTQLCMKNPAPEKVYKKVHEKEGEKPIDYQVYAYNGEMYRIEIGNNYLVVSPEHKVYVKINQEAEPKIDFKPTIEKPTILLESLSYLTNIPLPKSNVNANFGSPNDMYNTSAFSSYSQFISLGFSNFNVPILQPSFLRYLCNKQLIQNHPQELVLYKQPQDTYPLLQEYEQTSLLQEDLQHLPFAQCQDCLLSQPLHLNGFSVQDDSLIYEQNALLLSLSEPRFLKNISSYDINSSFSFIKFVKIHDHDGNLLVSPSCIMQSCFNMFFCEWYKECIKNFFYWNSSFKHFKNLSNHDSGVFESGLSMTDFAICNNIFVNFNSHKILDDNEIFKDFELQPVTKVYSCSIDDRLDKNNNQKNKEKNGFHSLVIESDKNPVSTRTRYIKQNLYKNISKTKENIDVKLKENPWVLKDREVIHYEPEPPKLDNSKLNLYLKLSDDEAGVAEAGNAPVLRTGTSKGTWVRIGTKIPAPALNSDLEFLELKCGDNIVENGWRDK